MKPSIVFVYGSEKHGDLADNMVGFSDRDIVSIPIDKFIDEFHTLVKAEIIVIDTSIPEATILSAISRIRQDPATYLLPIVTTTDTVSEKILSHIDIAGLKDMDALKDLMQDIQNFSKNVEELPQFSTSGEKSRLLFLQFLMSRGTRELIPYYSLDTLTGYEYPHATAFWDTPEAAYEQVTSMVNEGTFSGLLIDKMNACPGCQSWMMNFRDVCPECGSLDISMVEMVHHFRCSAVAPIWEFQSGQRLVCPKCQQELRHIGLDYDKPSDIFYCKACSLRFTDPNYNAICYNCGIICKISELGQRKIFHIAVGDGVYLTIEEILARAEARMAPTQKERALPDDYLNVVFVHEVQRGRRFNSSFGIMVFNILGSAFMPYDSKKFQKITRIADECLSNSLREVDMVFKYKPGFYVMILPETEQKGIKVVAERIAGRFPQYLEQVAIEHKGWRLSAAVVEPNTAQAEEVLMQLIDREMKPGVQELTSVDAITYTQ
jgi:hypothetical protein